VAEPAHAAIGDPTGTYGILIMQDGGVIVDNPSVAVSLGPTQIGTIGVGATPITIQLVTDGNPDFRVSHWYIDVPLSMAQHDLPGPTSLFDPTGGTIDVTITGLSFDGGTGVVPFIVDNNTFLTSFMRDHQGHFYESEGANLFDAYGHGIYDIQVPGEAYLDGDPTKYDFSVLESGAIASWTWSNIINPGLTTTIHNATVGGQTPEIPGYVYELGLAMGFVPEPATAALLVAGAVSMVLQRRRRR
jgi:hypothetical protein